MQLTERYVYDVTRRLPEAERAEVSRELNAMVADMMPENPTGQDETDVLTKLGSPSKMAEQYRQKPRYLISPSIYDMYISVLKNVIIVVACAFACIGAFQAVLAIADGDSANDVVGAVISGVVSNGFEGAIQALFWVTLGFIIADRNGYREKPWKVTDLPSLPEKNSVAISRSSTIVSIALTIIFTAMYVSVVRGGWVSSWIIKANDVTIMFPFSQAALERSVPFIAFVAMCSLIVAVTKLVMGRWCVQLCIATVIYDIISFGIFVHMLRWPDLLSADFVSYFYGLFSEASSTDFTVIIPSTILVFACIFAIDIGTAVWYTVKGIKK